MLGQLIDVKIFKSLYLEFPVLVMSSETFPISLLLLLRSWHLLDSTIVLRLQKVVAKVYSNNKFFCFILTQFRYLLNLRDESISKLLLQSPYRNVFWVLIQWVDHFRKSPNESHFELCVLYHPRFSCIIQVPITRIHNFQLFISHFSEWMANLNNRIFWV